MKSQRNTTQSCFRRRSLLLSVALTAIISRNLPARQNQAPATTAIPTMDAAAKAPEFEVASIKPSGPVGPEMRWVGMKFNADGFSAQSMSLKSLLSRAYGVPYHRLFGAQGWTESDQFDIEARMDDASIDTLSKLAPHEANLIRQQMLQALLADRFKLSVHRETRELSVFNLVVAKNGPKLHEAAPGDTYPNGIKTSPGQSGAGMIGFERDGRMTAQGIPMDRLAAQLSAQLGRTVHNQTGLPGNYDFILQFSRDDIRLSASDPGAAPPPDSANPSIFAALPEQLGLKLESAKEPEEVIVVDHVEKPSQN